MTKKSPCALGLAGLLSLAAGDSGGCIWHAAGRAAGGRDFAGDSGGEHRAWGEENYGFDEVGGGLAGPGEYAGERAGARRLDDGSVLNVGSESSMKVEKHDSGAQQTQLELTYGKLRSQAQKIAKPDGKFEVHTPAGVAGVVGTDFYVGFDNRNDDGDRVRGDCAGVRSGGALRAGEGGSDDERAQRG